MDDATGGGDLRDAIADERVWRRPHYSVVGSSVALVLVVAIGLARVRALRARVRRLEADALTDPLTGAFNRRYMDHCLAGAIGRQSRRGEPASLLLIDLDHLKWINDTAGHLAGDEVLKALAARLAGRARPADVLCRIGGDEFALVLAAAPLADALDVAEQLRRLVANEPVAGRRLAVSIGVAELRAGQSADEWFHDADAALYAAKRSGRNCVAGSDSSSGWPARYRQARVRVSLVR